MASNPIGFQPGNAWAAKSKVIDNMIRSVLTIDEDEAAKRQERSRLRRAIEVQLDKAASGELPSLDWLTCRLEGKAKQSVDMTVERTDIKSFTINE